MRRIVKQQSEQKKNLQGALNELNSAKAETEILLKKKSDLEKETLAHEVAYKEAKARHVEFVAKAKKKEAQLASLLDASECLVASHKEELNQIIEQEAETEELHTQLNNRNNALIKSIDDKRKQLAKLTTEFEELGKQVDSAKGNLLTVQKLVDDYEGRIDQLALKDAQRKEGFAVELAKIQEQISLATTQKDSVQNKLNILSSSLPAYEEELKNRKLQIDELNTRLLEKKEELEALEKACEEQKQANLFLVQKERTLEIKEAEIKRLYHKAGLTI